jgi:monoamine oxidase
MTAGDAAAKRFDAVVIGAGMSGLMAAALLAHGGRHVFVAEAADRSGGYQCRVSSDWAKLEPHFHGGRAEAAPVRLRTGPRECVRVRRPTSTPTTTPTSRDAGRQAFQVVP